MPATLNWASFPRWWVRDRLPGFTAGVSAGKNMAALKIYLAVALTADYRTRRAEVSWSELSELSGLSRPMLKRGIDSAQQSGILEVTSNGYRHSYCLTSAADQLGFAKLPKNRLRLVLPKLPGRGYIALDALKIYIALLTVRPRDRFVVPITHKHLINWTAIQPTRIRPAIDVLTNHRLIHVTKAEAVDVGHPHNEYNLLGFNSTTAAANPLHIAATEEITP